MNRGYNFGAGPAMLPESILLEAQAELLNWQNLNQSVMEIGHRTPHFTELMIEAEQTFRELLHIPQNYHVLFLGSAARTQFAAIPLNFLSENQQAGYWITGIWSKMAYEEACKLKQAYCIASSEANGFIQIPAQSEWQIRAKSAYVYCTTNETINGVRFTAPPKIAGVPLIADMTSCLLSEPINISDYGLIFAGAQKNIAPAGLTLVIIRDELLKTIQEKTIPTMLDYRTHCSEKSLYATPPTFNCYLAAKMFRWIKQQGGVDALYQQNCKKSAALYQYIDSSSFYYCPIAQESRSLVNICFFLANQPLEELFLSQAQAKKLYALKGHRLVGGLRASLYNAMPMAGVDCLIDFMQHFAKEHS